MFPKKDDSAESRALHEHDHEHHHDHDHSDVEDQGNISFQLFHLFTIGLGITAFQIPMRPQNNGALSFVVPAYENYLSFFKGYRFRKKGL